MLACDYRSPGSLAEALAEVAEAGDDGKVIAGGTALVIMLMQRLVRPARLISLRRVPGLDRIELADGALRLGALVTHREVETSPLVRRHLPVLAETYGRVATIRIRNMATVGGGLAHADPNQDPPVTLVALGARVRVCGPQGTRVVPLEAFFVDYYQTQLAPDELVVGVEVPLPPSGTGAAFLKFLPRTADDYATVAVAAAVTVGPDGRCLAARIGLGSLGPTTLRAAEAERLLIGERLDESLLDAAAEAARRIVDPVTDPRGSAEYKRDMAGVFVRRAIRQAWARATEGGA
ncbi:MAG TPA: xanthine dehydrogenase family protein subunit M [Thermodesulfobacteriota bacterium]|nr:xanthine dehydrogenase family protein subunit M [Thermodesulfobacteriota bacterium]